MSTGYRLQMSSPNIKKVQAKLGVQLDRMTKGAAAEFVELCTNIMKESKAEVPVQTGVLQSSGQVLTQEFNHKDKTIIRLGYALTRNPKNNISRARAREYAFRVHEDLYAFHPVGKAKFLEDPINRYKPIMPKKLVEAAKRSVK